MDEKESTVRKTPFPVFRWLVAIEFFFALLPFLAILFFSVAQSYKPVMRNVVDFLNSSGGTVLIVVDDDDQILGL